VWGEETRRTFKKNEAAVRVDTSEENYFGAAKVEHFIFAFFCFHFHFIDCFI